MTVDPHTRQAPRTSTTATPIISARPAAARSSSPIRRNISASAQPEPVAEGTIYTCPMHPEIRQVGPGSCPICGMALEPEIATADSGPNPELVDMTRRFWIGLALAAAGVRARNGRRISSARTLGRADAVELDPVRFRHAGGAVGRLAVLRARLAVARHAQSQHVHADRAWAPASPIVYSVVATFAPGIFPPAFRGHGGAVAVYFEAASGHHRAGAARPGARTARARRDLRRDPRAARSRAQDRAPRQRRRQRRGSAARRSAGRRPPARAPRRQGAGRRRRARGPLARSTNRW